LLAEAEHAALTVGESCPPKTRLQGLWGAGWLTYHQGDYQQNGQLGHQMLQLLAGEDDQLRRRNALTLIGNAALAEGRTGDAIAALSQALRLCEGSGTTWHLATSLLNLGTAQLRAHRSADAKELFSRALAIYEELGDQHFTARVLIQLGYAALTGGQPDEAAVPIRHAMRVSAQIADAWSIADGLQAVANLRRDNLKLAQRHIGEDKFAAAWAEGRETPAESIVPAALAATGAEED
jgi:tetratricopeptide (TPR) repeat protein